MLRLVALMRLSEWRWRSATGVFSRLVLGYVLAVAVTEKLLDVVQNRSWPLSDKFIGTSSWLNAGVLSLEIAAVLLLVMGPYPRVARVVAVGLFSCLLIVSSVHVIAGDASCSCFGSTIETAPWKVAIFDVAAVWASLFVFARLPRKKGWIATIGSLGLAFAAALVLTDVVSSDSDGQNARAASVPQWVGRPATWIDEIRLTENLAFGNWTIIFYRLDCSLCRRELQDLAESSWTMGRPNGDRRGKRVALVCVSGAPLPDDWKKGLFFFHGSWAGDTYWSHGTPLVTELSDGIVMSVRR